MFCPLKKSFRKSEKGNLEVGKGGVGTLEEKKQSPYRPLLSFDAKTCTDSSFTGTVSTNKYSSYGDCSRRSPGSGINISRFLPKLSPRGMLRRRKRRGDGPWGSDVGRPRLDEGPIHRDQPPWRAVCFLRERRSGKGTAGAEDIIKEQDWWRSERQSSLTSTSEDTAGDDRQDSSSAGASLTHCATETTLSVFSSSSAPALEPAENIFFNVGFSVWESSRAEWRRKPFETASETGTSADPEGIGDDDGEGIELKAPRLRLTLSTSRYEELVRGLTRQTSRAPYKLPKKLSLGDVVGVFVEAWDCDKD